jgi:hypothetical protein
MTFDPKPLLKGFGAAADVAGQIATDKAVNSRRLTDISSRLVSEAGDLASINSGYTSGVRASANPSNGELLTGVPIATILEEVEHNLGRTPYGAMIIGSSAVTEILFKIGTATPTTFEVMSTATGITVDIWVF